MDPTQIYFQPDMSYITSKVHFNGDDLDEFLGYFGYRLDLYNGQTGIQRWLATEPLQLEIIFFGQEASHENLFQWSIDAPDQTFTVLSNHQAYVGQKYLVTISRPGNITFQISDLNNGYTWSTDKAKNDDGLVHGLVYYPQPGVYLIGFEDLYAGGDLDYEDVVVSIEVKSNLHIPTTYYKTVVAEVLLQDSNENDVENPIRDTYDLRDYLYFCEHFEQTLVYGNGYINTIIDFLEFYNCQPREIIQIIHDSITFSESFYSPGTTTDTIYGLLYSNGRILTINGFQVIDYLIDTTNTIDLIGNGYGERLYEYDGDAVSRLTSDGYIQHNIFILPNAIMYPVLDDFIINDIIEKENIYVRTLTSTINFTEIIYLNYDLQFNVSDTLNLNDSSGQGWGRDAEYSDDFNLDDSLSCIKIIPIDDILTFSDEATPENITNLYQAITILDAIQMSKILNFSKSDTLTFTEITFKTSTKINNIVQRGIISVPTQTKKWAISTTGTLKIPVKGITNKTRLGDFTKVGFGVFVKNAATDISIDVQEIIDLLEFNHINEQYKDAGGGLNQNFTMNDSISRSIIATRPIVDDIELSEKIIIVEQVRDTLSLTDYINIIPVYLVSQDFIVYDFKTHLRIITKEIFDNLTLQDMIIKNSTIECNDSLTITDSIIVSSIDYRSKQDNLVFTDVLDVDLVAYIRQQLTFSNTINLNTVINRTVVDTLTLSNNFYRTIIMNQGSYLTLTDVGVVVKVMDYRDSITFTETLKLVGGAYSISDLLSFTDIMQTPNILMRISDTLNFNQIIVGLVPIKLRLISQELLFKETSHCNKVEISFNDGISIKQNINLNHETAKEVSQIFNFNDKFGRLTVLVISDTITITDSFKSSTGIKDTLTFNQVINMDKVKFIKDTIGFVNTIRSDELLNKSVTQSLGFISSISMYPIGPHPS